MIGFDDALGTNPGPEHLLRPRGFGRFVSAAFLAFWLCGWAIGESLVLWILIAGGIALLTGTPPEPGRELLEPGPAIAVGVFLLFWLTLWTFGGYAAITELLRLLWSRDAISADPACLRVHHRLGPFRSNVEIPRDRLCRIYVAPGDKSLRADTTTGPVVLSSLGTALERANIAAALRTELRVPEEFESNVSSLPDGWQEIVTPEGEIALVKDLAVRRTQARVALGLTLASATLALILIALTHTDPTVIGITVIACTAATGLTWGTTRLARSRIEWRIGAGSLTRRRRVGARLRDLDEISRLELTRSSDSDGDDWFSLEAVPGKCTIERAQGDPAIPRRLGTWLAQRANIPFDDRSTREATARDLTLTLAQLKASGALGRTLAGWLERMAAKQRNES